MVEPPAFVFVSVDWPVTGSITAPVTCMFVKSM